MREPNPTSSVSLERPRPKGCRQDANLSTKQQLYSFLAIHPRNSNPSYYSHDRAILPYPPGSSPCSKLQNTTKYPKELELITFKIFAAEKLRLIGYENRLIIDCFANVVNILIWLFSTNDRLRSAKYESNYLENPFPEIKGVNLLSKTHRNDKSNLRPMTVLQE